MGKLEGTVKGLKYDANGLVTAVCVDHQSRQVLMVGHMDQDAVLETVRTGKTHFWSRSRQRRWMKGESSGHTQQVKAIYVDCDKDALLIEVEQSGGACHEGYYSCFFRRLDDDGGWQVVAEKVFDPEAVYKRPG